MRLGLALNVLSEVSGSVLNTPIVFYFSYLGGGIDLKESTKCLLTTLSGSSFFSETRCGDGGLAGCGTVLKGGEGRRGDCFMEWWERISTGESRCRSAGGELPAGMTVLDDVHPMPL